jgi:hypothetical protein
MFALRYAVADRDVRKKTDLQFSHGLEGGNPVLNSSLCGNLFLDSRLRGNDE